MKPIQVRLGAVAEEKLAAAGVRACVGHRQGPGLVLVAVDLTGNVVARPAGSGDAAGARTAVGAPPLGHEAIDHPVEGEAVVETLACKLHEVGHRAGGIGIEELQGDGAGIGFHQSCGHGVGLN